VQALLRLVKPAPVDSEASSAREDAAPVSDVLAEVARAAAAGNAAATRTLLVSLGPHLLRTVRRVLGRDNADVEDVLQESASAVLDALPRFRGESSVLHFACRVTLLTAMNARRRELTRKRLSLRDDSLGVEQLSSPLPGPDSSLAARAAAGLVRELLDSLPLEQAEALALHCVLGYTVTEIASATNAPHETVRSRLRLAKRALRERAETDERLAALTEEP
jgi:RNA polymerase sigma-70 factor (ECF subfamily)